MWIFLCSAGSPGDLWAALRLREAGLAPLEIVTPRLFLSSRRFEFELDDGGARSRLVLADGREFHSQILRGVVNRVPPLGVDCFGDLRAEDRDYAIQETSAVLSAWLHSLPCPVVNPSDPGSPIGRARSWLEWTALAASAGIPALPSRQTCSGARPGIAPLDPQRRMEPPTFAYVVGDRAFLGEFAPADLGQAAPGLARMAGLALCGFQFQRDESGFTWLTGVDPWPDLRLAGPGVVRALACHLAGSS